MQQHINVVTSLLTEIWPKSRAFCPSNILKQQYTPLPPQGQITAVLFSQLYSGAVRTHSFYGNRTCLRFDSLHAHFRIHFTFLNSLFTCLNGSGSPCRTVYYFVICKTVREKQRDKILFVRFFNIADSGHVNVRKHGLKSILFMGFKV